MKHLTPNIILLAALPLSLGPVALAQQDARGCSDHPLLSRMPNYYILECKTVDFNSYVFYDPVFQGKKTTTVEGKQFYISYLIKNQFSGKYASPLQIVRNYENAIKTIGGTTYSWTQIGGGELHARYAKDGREVWVRIYINMNGGGYTMTLIEKGSMAQEVVADARFLSEGINAAGHVAVYGIYFDFNKADIKPESEPALKQITKMLQEDAKLRVYVVGHTDNAGGYDYNMKLSQQRADAVVKELVSRYGIAPERLKAGGVGPLAPVASNSTEDGKAKNRRVELVRQ